MVVSGLIFAGLAAVLHIYIFFMESIAWTSPAVRKTFGMSEEEARNTRQMAYNQGFYNLFLAVIAVTGILCFAVGYHTVGLTLVCAGIASMTGAALVLLLSDSSKRATALKQGFLPAVGLVLLVAGIIVG